MTAVTWKDQPRSLDEGEVSPGAIMSFSAAGGVTPIAAYADPQLSTPLPNPLTSSAAGRFPGIWIDRTIATRIRLETADGDEIYDEDPFQVFPGTTANTPLDDAGDPMPMCELTFWRAGTTILALIYDDNTLTSQLDNPLTADSSGVFPEIWLNDELLYRVKLENAAGELIYDIDDYQLLLQIIAPSAPVLSGDVVLTDFDLDWTAATAGTYPIDFYTLYRSEGGDPYLPVATVQEGDPREYQDTDVDEGVIYRYYVIATDTNGGESAQSNTVELSYGANFIIDVYTASGPWPRRPGLITADAICIAGGGGGASGECGQGATLRTGGGGGGGGGYSSVTGILAAALGATETVTVGAGGVGGTSVGSNTVGLFGADGGTSSFGAHLTAAGGGGGGEGAPSQGWGSGGIGGIGTVANGGDGGNAGGEPANAEPGGTSTFGAGGGGGGGTRPSGSFRTPGAGGSGPTSEVPILTGGAAATTGGQAGSNGESSSINRAGAGGGGGYIEAFGAGNDGGAGGGGGSYGGGGAGGGATTNSTGALSGAGGTGGGGIVIVTSYFV